MAQLAPDPPVILPVSVGVAHPKWSVMIPTFNGARYLEQTLESVLAQDQGRECMQIEVIDDCSTEGDPEAIVDKIGKGRISFYRNPENRGAISNFNVCVERSRGQFIHILHHDDLILPGFYDFMNHTIARWPGVGLYATRAFFIDEEGVICSVSPRIEALESPANNIEPFFYETKILTPAVVVRREIYEKVGGFRPELVFVADCEMWIRAIEKGMGVVSPCVLSSHRITETHETNRLYRTGDATLDIERFNALMASKYSDFDADRGRRRVYELAYALAQRFEKLGNAKAAEVNRRIWRERVSLTSRLILTCRVLIGEIRSLAGFFYRYILNAPLGGQR